MILLITGLPATGKTYFAKHLAMEIDAVHLNTDIARKEINKQGQYDEQSKEQVYKYLKEEMIRHAKLNRHVIVDGTFQKKKHRDLFEREARKYTPDVYFVEMCASEQTIRQRLRSERKYSEADYKVYRQIKHTFERMTGPHLVLWSDRNEVTELIRQLKQYING